MKKLASLLLCFSLVLANPVWAQEEGGESDEDDFVKSTQTDILIVAASGAAGAILGLSTLSFVEEPRDHVNNIWTGAAVGIIAGVIFVAYNSATRSQENLEGSVDFNSYERVAWHHIQQRNLTDQKVQFGTQFWQMNF